MADAVLDVIDTVSDPLMLFWAWLFFSPKNSDVSALTGTHLALIPHWGFILMAGATFMWCSCDLSVRSHCIPFKSSSSPFTEELGMCSLAKTTTPIKAFNFHPVSGTTLGLLVCFFPPKIKLVRGAVWSNWLQLYQQFTSLMEAEPPACQSVLTHTVSSELWTNQIPAVPFAAQQSQSESTSKTRSNIC